MLLNIFLGLIGLGFLVIIHEWGHFIAARLSGVEVEAFSVGWGPVLLTTTRKGTEYRLSAIPLGGYCKMKGSETLQKAIEDNKDEIPKDPGSFYAAAWWKRIIILAAGPAVNVITAAIFFYIVFSIGFSYETYPNRIVVASQDDSPAAQAGLADGDYITGINSTEVNSFEDIRREISTSAGRTLTVEYMRDDRPRTTEVTPELAPETGIGRIGIYPYIQPVISDRPLPEFWSATSIEPGDRITKINSSEIDHAVQFEQYMRGIAESDLPVSIELERNGRSISISISRLPSDPQQLSLPWKTVTAGSPSAGPGGRLGLAVAETYDTVILAARGLQILFSGVQVTQAVSGPIQITHMVGEVATRSFAQGLASGAVAVLQFLGLISVILAFMNMLPIPALDGGQIMLTIYERISPKPVKPRFVARYQNIGAIIVLLLIAFAVTSDLLFLFQG